MSTPYTLAAPDYFQAGWSPIPLPHQAKSPVPDGFTGAEGAYVTASQVAAWCRKVRPARASAGKLSFPPSNIALRLPPSVLGIDADLYDGKAGAATMSAAIARWGALPPTWISTSRYDGSGIMLFRIPEGLAWPGQVGPGVETIRWDHRYAVVAPSVHDKTHKTYAWIRPDGVRVTDEIPSVDELPALPATWVEGLTSGASWVSRPVAGDMTAEDCREWLAQRNEHMCDAMRGTITKYSREIRTAGDDGGAHEKARDAAWALIGDAAAGHGGVREGLNKVRKVFLAGVSERRRDAGEAADEWTRICVRGIQKAAAEGEPEEDDICAMLGGGGGSETSGAAGGAPGPNGSTSGTSSSIFDYERDDIGNGQRLVNRVGSDARYVPGWGAWALYDNATSLWRVDQEDAAITREMMSVVRAMGAEAAFIEDAKVQSSFLAFVRQSGNAGRLKAAVDMAQAMKGMTVEPAIFDADPEILVCGNGTLELGAAGATFRGTRHSDYATFSTGTDYVEGAVSLDWSRFIEVVLPDPDDQRWVQTLAGYSMFGANPERILVIAKGPTTSGKTTFVEAVHNTLGQYAASFNLSLFREKQDESPRNDIVEALPKRWLAASEASSEWFLHADAVKRFTGGDYIRARRLNSNIYIERTPAFTPWLATNSYPQIPGADKALWRRLQTAPFGVSIPEDEIDTGLRTRLRTPEARSAILAWLVAGWELYARDGLREPSAASLELKLEARDEMSDLDAFLAEACRFEAEANAPGTQLYEAYKMWMSNNGNERGTLSQSLFGRGLAGRGYEKVKRPPEKGSDRRIWYRLGLELNDDWSRLIG